MDRSSTSRTGSEAGSHDSLRLREELDVPASMGQAYESEVAGQATTEGKHVIIADFAAAVKKQGQQRPSATRFDSVSRVANTSQIQLPAEACAQSPYRNSASVQPDNRTSARGKKRKRNAKRHTKEEWDTVKEMFTEFYLRRGLDLSAAADLVQQRYDFVATEGQWKRKICEWNISKRLENPGKERLEFGLEALGLSKGEDAHDPETNSQGLVHTWSDDKVTSTASQDSVYQHHRRQLASQMKESPRREQKRTVQASTTGSGFNHTLERRSRPAIMGRSTTSPLDHGPSLSNLGRAFRRIHEAPNPGKQSELAFNTGWAFWDSFAAESRLKGIPKDQLPVIALQTALGFVKALGKDLPSQAEWTPQIWRSLDTFQDQVAEWVDFITEPETEGSGGHRRM